MDLRKAFDTVDHEILCKKLHIYGIKGRLLEWCTNYLKNRSRLTLVNNTRSKREGLNCGVPQGSVLGPLFFILYVNDVVSALEGVKIQSYADDTVIFASGKDTETLRSRLQNNLYVFQKWCDGNKLTLNPQKTKMVAF